MPGRRNCRLRRCLDSERRPHERNPAAWVWAGIAACIAQSAAFSGLNLAVFSLSQLRLQIEADGGNADAARLLELRKNSNQVLATIIWGNISTNVLLTLLSDLALAGVYAFLFSAMVLMMFGEIFPQAYFSRNALQMTTRFMPFLRFYLFILYPLTKPTAMLLDWWLGVEGIAYLREKDVRSLIARSAASGGDIGKLEATGAQNFLDLDDLKVTEEGELLHPDSIISLPIANNRCVLPSYAPAPDDPFLHKIQASHKKWIVVTDPGGEPVFVLDADHFLRDALFGQLQHDPTADWHRPIVVKDMKTCLGQVIGLWKVDPERADDDVVDHDLILVWGEQRRIITGSDLLGRLLRNIATVENRPAEFLAHRALPAQSPKPDRLRGPHRRASLLGLLEIPQIRRRLIFLGRHQQPLPAQVIVLGADDDLVVAFGAGGLDPVRPRFRALAELPVDTPGTGQGMIEHGDFFMEDIGIALVEMEPLLEERLVVEVQRQPCRVIGARSLEGATRLDLENVVAAIAILIDPMADGVAFVGRFAFRRPVAPVGEDATELGGRPDQDVGRIRRDHIFLHR